MTTWTPTAARRDAIDVLTERAEQVADEARVAGRGEWEDDRWPENESRPWSRELWMETGNGYY